GEHHRVRLRCRPLPDLSLPSQLGGKVAERSGFSTSSTRPGVRNLVEAILVSTIGFGCDAALFRIFLCRRSWVVKSPKEVDS
ncbi:hypothetical protein G7B21_29100, partial [Klebsiella pneumoniae]|nr:hypothetical protein [Klebsiella pneumoniae]